MYRKYQMARIIEVANLIHNEPRKWTRPQLAERLEVNKATIQRDINLLCDMGIETVPCGKQGYEIISDFFLPALNLTFEEVLALFTSARFYRAAEGKQPIKVLDSAIHKITADLPARTISALRQIAPLIEVPNPQVSPVDEAQPHKEKLYEAIRARRKVSIMYDSFSSGQQKRYLIAPYAVMFRKRAWYLIGYVESYGRVQTFRINRIQSVSITYTTYTIPENFSVQGYMEKSWDVRLGRETHVVIEFAQRIAPLIREVRWHSTQQIQETADGKLRFGATVAGWQEIGWWVLTWGDEAEVIAPNELRAWVAQTAEKMVTVYRNK